MGATDQDTPDTARAAVDGAGTKDEPEREFHSFPPDSARKERDHQAWLDDVLAGRGGERR